MVRSQRDEAKAIRTAAEQYAAAAAMPAPALLKSFEQTRDYGFLRFDNVRRYAGKEGLILTKVTNPLLDAKIEVYLPEITKATH